jgi:hypothetical protein
MDRIWPVSLPATLFALLVAGALVLLPSALAASNPVPITMPDISELDAGVSAEENLVSDGMPRTPESGTENPEDLLTSSPMVQPSKGKKTAKAMPATLPVPAARKPAPKPVAKPAARPAARVSPMEQARVAPKRVAPNAKASSGDIPMTVMEPDEEDEPSNARKVIMDLPEVTQRPEESDFNTQVSDAELDFPDTSNNPESQALAKKAAAKAAAAKAQAAKATAQAQAAKAQAAKAAAQAEAAKAQAAREADASKAQAAAEAKAAQAAKVQAAAEAKAAEAAKVQAAAQARAAEAAKAQAAAQAKAAADAKATAQAKAAADAKASAQARRSASPAKAAPKTLAQPSAPVGPPPSADSLPSEVDVSIPSVAEEPPVSESPVATEEPMSTEPLPAEEPSVADETPPGEEPVAAETVPESAPGDSSSPSYAEGSSTRSWDRSIPKYDRENPSWGFDIHGSLKALGSSDFVSDDGAGNVTDYHTRNFGIGFEYEPEFLQSIGVVSIGPSANLYVVEPMGDITNSAFSIFSLGASIKYQLRFMRGQPIVPFAGFEAQMIRYSFAGDTDAGQGWTTATGPVFGALLLLNWMEPSAAHSLWSDTGIKRSYLVGEMKMLKAGEPDLSVDGSALYFGLRMEY